MPEQKKTNCSIPLSFITANSKNLSWACTHFTYTAHCLRGLYGHILHHKTQISHSLLFVSSNNPSTPSHSSLLMKGWWGEERAEGKGERKLHSLVRQCFLFFSCCVRPANNTALPPILHHFFLWTLLLNTVGCSWFHVASYTQYLEVAVIWLFQDKKGGLCGSTEQTQMKIVSAQVKYGYTYSMSKKK